MEATQTDQIHEDIVKTICEPLLILDQDLRVILASRSFYKFFKVTPDETVGQLIYDLGNKQWDIPRLRELLETILPENTSFDNYEVEHDFTTIGRRTMLLNARQIEQAMGKERIILLAIDDITERKRLEHLLIDSEERFRRLFETANDGILLLEKHEGKITHSNPAIMTMLGYSKDELIGSKLYDVGFPNQLGTIQEIMQKLEKDGIIHYKDVPLQKKTQDVVSTDIYMVDKASLVQCNIRDITEQKLADEALRESEELLSRSQELAHIGSWKLELIENHLTWSDEVYRIFGCEPQEFAATYEAFLNFVHPDDRAAVDDAYSRSLREGNNGYEIEHRIVRRNSDEIRYVHERCVHERNTAGTTIQSTGMVQDITERKKDLIALRENRQLLQSMLEAIPDMVSVHDRDMTILYSNWNGFGSVPEEKRIIGTKCYHTYRGYNEICPDCQAKTVLQTNRNFQTEARLPDGRWVDLRVIPILDNDGRVDMFMEWVRDITERKQADLDVRSQKRLLEGVLDSINDIIGVQLPDHTMVQYNRAGYELLGLTEDQVRGKKCYELLGNPVPCDHCATSRTYISKRMETVEKFIPELGRHFLCNSNPVLDDNGNIKLIIEQLTDITEKKKIDEKLQQAQKMESIGTLAGGIAHDFNNILFPIIGHSEILMDDVPKDSPLQDSLKEIYTGALRAKDLVQQILAFARQEKNELKMMRMQPIIKEALKLIRSTIPTTIGISRNIQPNCGAVKADPTQIHQIVMNLATNAWHAMAETGGKLIVSLKQIELDEYNRVTPEMSPGPYACLTVTDTGTGMDQELIHRIFDPFFTTKEKGRGTGMGLSVIHGIVKNMSGVIQVSSQPGKGSEFHIYLPVVETVSQTQKIKTGKPIPGGMERILLVDDEPAIIALENASLSRLGYQVSTCTSSTQALEIFRSGSDQFDLVITDMTMPNISGDRLAGELIKIRPDIPILLCTGFSDSLTDEKIKSLGIRGLLSKPLVIRDLAEKIREVLDNTPTGN